MKVTAVIKASCRSYHFPDRYKTKIGDLSLLDFMVQRLQSSELVNNIVLATSDNDIDDVLAEAADNLKITTFRGAYEDSIGRVFGAARMVGSDIVVKISGNYPFIDILDMDKLLGDFMGCDAQYAYNEHYRGVILGLGVEVFNYQLIEKANREISSKTQRRFGTDIFKEILAGKDLLIREVQDFRPNYRATLAVPNDALTINQIFKECKKLDHANIVKYLDSNPVVVRYAEQNIEGPREVGVEKLLLFSEKTNSIIKSQENSVDYSYPVSVELSLTNRCNLACKWCSDSSLRKKSMVDIDFDILRKLIDDLAGNGTQGIVIEGGGEPTLYPGFHDVVTYAKESGLAVGLISNGVKVPYLDFVDLFDWIRISLDAANRQQFVDGKGKDHFADVLTNIESIIRHRSSDKVTVGVAYVLTNDNEANIEELVNNLSKIDVSYIQFRPVIDHPELMPNNFNLDFLKKYATKKFTVNIHNMAENTARGNLSLPCYAHSLSTVITANGDVYLCGRLNKYDWIEPIGNLKNKSFYEIWHGEERARQAKMVLDRDFCREWCPECRLTKFNVLLENTSNITTGNFI